MTSERSSLLAHETSTDSLSFGDELRMEGGNAGSSDVKDKGAFSILPIHQGSASESETIVNIVKLCMGTGCLALPYSAQQGGLLLNCVGMFAVATWNTSCVERFCDCQDKLIFLESIERQTANEHTLASSSPHPPRATATLSKVTWRTMGWVGVVMVEIIQIFFFTGVIVAYQDACRSFLKDASFSSNSDWVDASVLAVIMASLSVVPDLGYLTKVSALGIGVLMVTLAVTTAYGISEAIDGDGDDEMATASAGTDVEENPLSLLPDDGLVGMSTWFGCIVFSFGIAPLTYNFRESMAEPKKLVSTTQVSVLAVAAMYVVIGVSLWALFPQISGEVLHELPQEGILPTVTRVSMLIVVLVTAPLLIVPCGELFEGKMLQLVKPWMEQQDPDSQLPSTPSVPYWMKAVVRFGVCFLSALLSVAYPGFVKMLGFVGAFAVAIMGFCIPPLVHILSLRLVHRAEIAMPNARSFAHDFILDLVLLVWGITATCLSTIYTFRQINK
eukprot:CAMPEP_0198121308 /NCGR_PEP_ID=MMETSP1442-20131203/31738_1 /TAXON_ID= /ORGANISM="Craspedostauros australis, Strain CCMP3328" /LENGTH=500 /DNA_ID=CAMNT_0043780091 /DNA_START=125 /DNA_END=1627 /DNA_ORIENTATION=-